MRTSGAVIVNDMASLNIDNSDDEESVICLLYDLALWEKKGGYGDKLRNDP